ADPDLALAAHPPSARAGLELESDDGTVGRHPRGVGDLPAAAGREAPPHRHLPERARRRAGPVDAGPGAGAVWARRGPLGHTTRTFIPASIYRALIAFWVP